MTIAKASWRSPQLGEAATLQLRQAPLRAHATGSGPPLVFAHGLLVNANLWRKVVPRLSSEFRCVALDLPLGSHIVPLRADADLSPPGLAHLIADAMEALGVENATLIGNDTGGALCQLVVTRRPERVGRLVLTSCDAFDNFPPWMFRYLKPVARLPASVLPALFAPLRLRQARRLPIAFGWVTNRPIDREAEDSYIYPALTNAAIRHDVRRVLRQLDARYTREAAERLKEFDRPALIAWSRDDRFFPPAHAERLAAALPNARLEWIDNARTFSPEDQPERLAELIAGFSSASVP
jgi:pimeloyl-ACP methyl ester carboxylesterase